ncbi:MAG: DHA2 family efflux MFS transporter permease subunit, partial [Actinobacteria bacterium]|nr:DHA2 family efflux MFS transporter permease subunit [Actinomycetota bacterium]
FSLACGLAPNIGWLIAFRVGQSIGAAAMIPVSLTILMSAFPRHQHGMATAFWGVMGSVAAAVGPTLGGILTQYASWHWIFYVNVPLGIITIAGALVFVPEHRQDLGSSGIDLLGIALSGLAFFALTLGLIQGNGWGWASGRVLGLLIGAVALLVLFGFWESRAPSPMLNLKLFRIRSFTSATASMSFIGIAVGGALLLIVIFMVNVLGYSEVRAAISITPMPAVGLILGPVIGSKLDKLSPRVLAAIGGILFGASLVLLARLGPDASLGDIAWRIVIMGAGFTFTMPALTAAGMGSLPEQARGIGSGVLNTGRQFGLVLGVAILVAIFSHTITSNITSAATEAKAYVSSQSQISATAREQIIAALDKAAAQSGGGSASGAAGGVLNPLAGVPQAPAGSTQAKLQQQLQEKIGLIFKDGAAMAFKWPFYGGALVALLSIPFSLMVGRRIGQHREETSAPVRPFGAERRNEAPLGASGRIEARPGTGRGNEAKNSAERG